jgi:hypothetical protein
VIIFRRMALIPSWTAIEQHIIYTERGCKGEATEFSRLIGNRSLC